MDFTRSNFELVVASYIKPGRQHSLQKQFENCDVLTRVIVAEDGIEERETDSLRWIVRWHTIFDESLTANHFLQRMSYCVNDRDKKWDYKPLGRTYLDIL